MQEREPLKGTSIKIPMSKYEVIQNMAKKEGISVTEVILKLLDKAMSERIIEDNMDLMAKVMRQQMEIVLKPHVERLAAISSKTGHMAATSAFLNTQALMDLVPVEKRKDAKQMYENARKKAVVYMKTKTDEYNEEQIFDHKDMREE